MKGFELYAFGSIVRGEIDALSDVDILAIITDSSIVNIEFRSDWSVYSKDNIASYFRDGKLFAWHLYLESKCIFSDADTDFLMSLGRPNDYTESKDDIAGFIEMIKDCFVSIENKDSSLIYEIGLLAVCIRDIAMCASWSLCDKPVFSRVAPFLLPINSPVSLVLYNEMYKARFSNTRGVFCDIRIYENLIKDIDKNLIFSWANDILVAL